MINNQIQI